MSESVLYPEMPIDPDYVDWGIEACGTCRWMRDGFCCGWASRRQGHPVCDLQKACPVWMPREDANHDDA